MKYLAMTRSLILVYARAFAKVYSRFRGVRADVPGDSRNGEPPVSDNLDRSRPSLLDAHLRLFPGWNLCNFKSYDI